MYQNIEIIGHLGRKPEMKYSPSGQAVTNFSVATTNAYTSKSGEKVKETTWFRVSVWGTLAENCNKFLDKGSLVKVEGRLSMDKVTGGPNIFTKTDGTTSANFEINGNSVLFLSSKSETTHSEQVTANAQSEDEFPF
jgi:single-strand DNA-binding protein